MNIKFNWRYFHVDYVLLSFLILLIGYGLLILYSASNENSAMLLRQGLHLTLAFGLMFGLAFVSPHRYKLMTPWFYAWGLFLLIAVMIMGKIGKGAQRWLDLGLIRFQPSELMKLAVPMMIAWYIDRHPHHLNWQVWLKALMMIFIPALLIAKQPDLGTAILVAVAGLTVIFIAGLPWRYLVGSVLLGGLAAPLLWHVLHDYQKKRLLMLLDPEQDPLGSGYHIIQSKIAIGSGGFLGKGWLLGSQSHLNFLPEHATDFIFAVTGEEFGFVGSMIMIVIFILIGLRGMHIALLAQSTYTRLLAAGLSMSFFFCGFVNMGMVMGILPVVGVPLPMISYGGTAMLTFMAAFGVLMSISTHKNLFRPQQ